MQPEIAQLQTPPVAVLKHLTGPSRGKTTFVGERELNVILRPGRILEVSAEMPSTDAGKIVARLRRSDGTFELVALEDHHLWVNGQRVQSRRLENHDMIEFDDVGPMSRVHLYRDGQLPNAGISEILSDAAAYLRLSRKPLNKRLSETAVQVARRLVGEATLLFRIGVLVALIALAVIVYQQSRINTLLRHKIETSATQIEGFSRRLAQAQKEALTPADLTRLHEALSRQVATAAERLSKLEQLSTAAPRVIAQSRSSILFLQGAYALREKSTGRMLRHVVGPDGHILVLPTGAPLLSLEGKGPVAERQFTGTGFVLRETGTVVTSGHVGQPWMRDVNVRALLVQELEPVIVRFAGYFPDSAESIALTLVTASEADDIALLRLERPPPSPRGLRLAKGVPKPGDEVVLLGYPTGVRSMLAQAGRSFVKQLQQEKQIDFWKIATRLAAAGRIVPLASRGIVGRTSEEAIVYDAETTHGGSGGPVLDMNGMVVAINSAILPEYGGSNLGVPASKLRHLIAEAKSRQ